MYTAFIADTKTALSGLWESVKNIHEQQAANAARFQPDYAETENARLDDQKANACEAAWKKIASICDKATEDAATLDKISVFDVEPDALHYKRIMELLSPRYTLSVEQLQHLIDTHIPQTNRALLNAVRTYAKSRNMRLIAADTASRRSAIAEIKASALDTVSKIKSANFKNQNADFSLSLIVSNFCQDGDFASELYAKLGQKFSGELVPARVEPGDGGFDFHFQRVRDSEAKAG